MLRLLDRPDEQVACLCASNPQTPAEVTAVGVMGIHSMHRGYTKDDVAGSMQIGVQMADRYRTYRQCFNFSRRLPGALTELTKRIRFLSPS
jgi:hypothetical protein